MGAVRFHAKTLAALLLACDLAACSGGGSPGGGMTDTSPAMQVTAPSTVAAGNGVATIMRTAQGLNPAAAVPQLAIDPTSYILVSSKRLSLTTFSYTYRVTVVNSGADALNVTASVTSTAGNALVTAGAVTFGDVSAGVRVASQNTFTVQVTRTSPVTPAAFQWTFAFDTKFAATLDSAARATATVSINGGTVTTTSTSGIQFSLEVPGAGLTAPTTTSVTPITSVTGLDVLGPLVAAVHLDPAGTVFRRPATLSISGIALDPAQLQVYAISDDGHTIEALPFDVLQGSLVIDDVNHFSDIAVFGADAITKDWCAAAGSSAAYVQWNQYLAQLDPNLYPQIRALGVLATLQAWLRQCNPVDDPTLTPSFDYVAQAYVNEMTRWFNAQPDGVAGLLTIAATPPSRTADAAIDQYETFVNTSFNRYWLELLSYSSQGDETVLDPLVSAGAGLVPAALSNQFAIDNSDCQATPASGDGLLWSDLDFAGYLETVWADYVGSLVVTALNGMTANLFSQKYCGTTGLNVLALNDLRVGETRAAEVFKQDGSLASDFPAVSLVYNVLPDNGVASVDANGIVKGLAPGQTNLHAAHMAGAISLMDTSAPINVPALDFQITPAVARMRRGLDFANDTVNMEITSNAGPYGPCPISGYSWFTSDVGIVDVTPGENTEFAGVGVSWIPAFHDGTATITATCQQPALDGDHMAAARVTVYSSIILTPQNACLTVGQTQQLTVSLGADAFTDLFVPVTLSVDWALQSPGIVSVDASGVLTGLAPGSTSIQAILNDHPGSAPLTSSTTFTVTPFPLCGSWAIDAYDVQMHPYPETDTYHRIAVVTPTGSANLYNVTVTGVGSFQGSFVGNTMTWSDVHYDGWYFSCADNVVTVNDDGTLSGYATWTEHLSQDCSTTPVADGYTTFTGSLQQ